MKERTQILFYASLKCNLRCSYCGFFNGINMPKEQGRDLRWFEIITALAPYIPYDLECCGGEPLLYPDFRRLIQHIPDNSNWAITSNTLLPVDNIAPRHMTWWNASFHFQQEEKFLDNCKTLTRSGMKPSISMVCTKDNIDEIEHYVHLFSVEHKYTIKLLKEVNEGVDWRGTKDYQRLLKLKNERVLLCEDDDSLPFHFQFNNYTWCNSGTAIYFCLTSDGTVYRCNSQLFRGEENLGHIFDFRPFKEKQYCGKECRPCGIECLKLIREK